MVRAAGARCHLWAVHLRIGACTGSPFVQYNKTGTSFEVPVLFEHGSSAVSYTHLDVYKRQNMHSADCRMPYSLHDTFPTSPTKNNWCSKWKTCCSAGSKPKTSEVFPARTALLYNRLKTTHERRLPMYRIDLNSDLGESFGRYTLGLDDQIIPLVSSANICLLYTSCGSTEPIAPSASATATPWEPSRQRNNRPTQPTPPNAQRRRRRRSR